MILVSSDIGKRIIKKIQQTKKGKKHENKAIIQNAVIFTQWPFGSDVTKNEKNYENKSDLPS